MVLTDSSELKSNFRKKISTRHLIASYSLSTTQRFVFEEISPEAIPKSFDFSHRSRKIKKKKNKFLQTLQSGRLTFNLSLDI